MKVLIFAAHPDDEILGMGGTIAKHAADKDEVQVVFLATGILARGQSKKNISSLKKLRLESRKALRLLGAKNPKFERLPDNQMDSVPLLRVVKTVEKYIKKYRPEVIYTHNQTELNIDHVITHRAVITATRPYLSGVKSIYAFSVPEANMYNFPANFSPNHFVDVRKFMNKKVEAMKEYKLEMRQEPHVRSLVGIKIVARYYGFMAGVKFAEPFIQVRRLA